MEPVQLQIVCERLWTLPRHDQTTIGKMDVDRLGDAAATLVDDSLRDYYREAA